MATDEPLRPGRRAHRELTVKEADTALAMGSGDVPVLASPRVLALAEAAAVQALEGGLADGLTSVGAWAELDHRMPTPVGGVVTAEASLLGVHDRRLEFVVSVTDADGNEVARLRHRRIVVDRDRFLAR